MRLRIELLSDLCTSAGEIYNTLADIDVVYDRKRNNAGRSGKR